MNRKDYRTSIAELCEAARTRITPDLLYLLLKKNKDYTKSDENQFMGFITAAQLSGTDGPERVIFSRIIDKILRASNLLTSDKPPAIVDEKLRDTMLDIAGYSIIMVAFLDYAEKLGFVEEKTSA
jgi:hypothetical protein